MLQWVYEVYVPLRPSVSCESNGTVRDNASPRKTIRGVRAEPPVRCRRPAPVGPNRSGATEAEAAEVFVPGDEEGGGEIGVVDSRRRNARDRRPRASAREVRHSQR